jgi:membrane protein DedA with SNARE-associated domain
VFAIVLMQSSGVPVPGTTALAAAAIYAAATHHLAIAGVILAAALAATLGSAISFSLGRSGGSRVLERYGHRVRITDDRLELGRRFFAAHGGKVVFLSRFVTGLRTWGGLIAGVARMKWARFMILNVAGAIAWATWNGLGYFYFGKLLTRASTGVEIALVALGVAWLAFSAAYVRKRVGNAMETQRQRHGPTVTREGNSVEEGT